MRLSNAIAMYCLTGLALAHPVELPPDSWSVEFITQEGTYSRNGMYTSREACEAAVHKVEKQQKGSNAHCVEIKVTPTGMTIEGSQDPAWAGK